MRTNVYKRIIFLLSLLFGTVFSATLLYHYVERIPLFTSFYMTIITLSTVGFAEVIELSTAGRIITICVIFSGITIVAYSASSLLKLVIEGELQQSFGRKKLERSISRLINHYIVCGYGRIGSLIANELYKNKIDCVVIERNERLIDQLKSSGRLYIQGDATDESVLISAGIHQAKGIVTAVKSDVDNVFIVLSARSIKPDIYILSRATEKGTEQKLKKAGATKVILPYLIGGMRMAQTLISPAVADFVDITMVDSELGLEMGEARIEERSLLARQTLLDSNIRKDYGMIVVAIKKADGTMKFNPTSEVVLEPNDVIVVLGQKKDLVRLKVYCSGRP
ncbi:MAG: potassium channel family protein [Spirochaetota bacterium]